MGKDKEISERKQAYRAKLENLLDSYKTILIVTADNVGSNQMQKIRIALRGKGILLMGKNTIMRKVIREKIASSPKFEKLLPQIVGNIGFVFTNSDMNDVRKTIEEHKVPAAARVGTIAPGDCFVPAGPTGLDPGQTGFFQALNIATKIVRGSIEIVNQVHLIKKGDKVTSSAVALLAKLDIKPFFYGIVVNHVYENGAVYPAAVLDVTQEELLAKFVGATNKLRALSLAARWPSELTLSYHMANGFRKLLALSLATNYKFKEAEALTKAAAEAPKQAAAKPAAKDEKKGGDDKAKGGKPDDKGKGKKDDKPAAAAPEPEPEDADVGVGGLFD